MRVWAITMFASAIFLSLFAPNVGLAQSGPDSAYEARPAMGFSPAGGCPELHLADDGPAAVIVFRVNTYGMPSQISVKSSSQSPELDAAALKCVQRLKFQPRTGVGDGAPVESWQQIGWRWVRPNVPAAAGAGVAAMPAAAGAVPAAARADDRVDLRVCADEAGTLTQDPTVVHSSGDARLDEAARKIARAGSGNYRPVPSVNGKAASGCAQITIRFETR